jgi:hypothetical protein
MQAISTDTLKGLGALTQAPCLSLYQPTHRNHPENLQDRLQFKRSIDVLYTALIPTLRAQEAQALLLPFQRLADDADFWDHTLDGLAVFASPLGFRVFVLPQSVVAQTTVASEFHTSPLRRFLQSVDRYQVLCLSHDQARLFEGNRDALEEVVLGPEVPSNAEHAQTLEGRALGEDRFFSAVDQALLKHHSKPSGLPLILAALPEHQHRFRQLSQNKHLLPVGLDLYPGAMNIRALSIMAWNVVEPQHNAREQVWIDAFVVARAQGRGSDDVRKTALAASQGRVGLLLIESEKSLSGQFDRRNGHMVLSKSSMGHDVLDDIAELVERQGGAVRVIPAGHMPTRSGLAAAMRA